MNHSSRARRRIALLLSAVLAFAGLAMISVATPAAAASTGSGVSYTLEGCRNNGDVTLPRNDGKFICPDSAYTTGNLGKGWNELDLVPARVTVAAGGSAPATQNFAFALVVDREDAGKPGYDVLSVPVLNPALSTGNCGTVNVSSEQHETPGLGGTDDSLYRTLSITGQAKNSTCVYDAYARLALGSHLYSGSSLHFNLTNDALTTAGIGAKEVSIPVKEILPQDLTKSMSAQQGSSYNWSVAKTGTANVNLGDTCNLGGSATAQITVEWTKSEADPGKITVNTVVTAINPASRAITVNVTDRVYGNEAGDGAVLETFTGSASVAAHSSATVIDETFELEPGSATNGFLSNRATASYTDDVTGVAVPGTTTAFAKTTVSSGSASQDTAVVTDDEWWSDGGATGVAFSVDQPSVGSFTGGYTAGTEVSGDTHVGWTSGTVSGSGSVTFTKTITAPQGSNATATLSDIATVTPTGGTAVSSGQQNIPVSVSTTVALQINKTIPNDLTAGEEQTFEFRVKDSTNAIVASPTVTFTAGEFDKALTPVTGLAPGSYTVSEVTKAPYSAQTDQTVTMTGQSTAGCSGSATFNNRYGPATAKATKVTVPTGSQAGWSMTLTGPGAGVGGETVQTNASGVATFTTALQEGNYTITETAQAGWDQTNATSGCTFSVNYPDDADRVFDGCTFTNTQRGALKVTKTVVANDSGNTLSDTFEICVTGPSPATTKSCKNVGISGGPVTWSNLIPGTYAVSETNPGSGWVVDISQPSVTVNPGSTTSTSASTVTNTRKGVARVVKTVSANDGSGAAVPGAGEAYTFTLRTGATQFIGHPGTILETKVANAANEGKFNFATALTPGSHYQVCETLPDTGWTIELGIGQFVPEQYLNDGVTLNPGVVNNVYCVDFVATPGPDPTVFNVNNRRPPGGSALTIGYWKNWASCSKSAQKKENSLDQALYQYGSNGMVVAADNGGWPLFAVTYNLRIKAGDNPNVALGCTKAVALLNKSTFDGKKKASDPAFNMAAQLVAAQLNYKADAATTVTSAINQAVLILGQHDFNGKTHLPISKASAATMNSLATTLDRYNNNVL